MSLALPFKASSFAVYEVESRERELKLAVRVLDEFTRAGVLTPVSVWLSQKMPGGTVVRQTAVRNHSGHFCFEDVVNGTYVLVTEPDPVLDHYFLHPELNQPWLDSFARDVVIPNPGGVELVVTLAPKPGYPFPSGTTIARGRVVDNAGDGVNRAVVSTSYSQSQPIIGDPDASAMVTAETRTDREGYFALFFRSLHVTPSVVQVTAKEGVRQAVQSVQIKEREESQVPELQFP
jgi:hypothetical protein